MNIFSCGCQSGWWGSYNFSYKSIFFENYLGIDEKIAKQLRALSVPQKQLTGCSSLASEFLITQVRCSACKTGCKSINYVENCQTAGCKSDWENLYPALLFTDLIRTVDLRGGPKYLLQKDTLPKIMNFSSGNSARVAGVLLYFSYQNIKRNQIFVVLHVQIVFIIITL